jgi:hypothetical protein
MSKDATTLIKAAESVSPSRMCSLVRNDRRSAHEKYPDPQSEAKAAQLAVHLHIPGPNERGLHNEERQPPCEYGRVEINKGPAVVAMASELI